MLEALRLGGGIPSICSAHPAVLKEAFRTGIDREVLIESTCNQVNQFGGYTGMTPAQFAAYVKAIAIEEGYPVERVLLGGDHLGPHVWQNEPSSSALHKAVEMVQEYARAGYQKFHLDCSMHLADDPSKLEPLLAAQRAALLAKAIEESVSSREGSSLPRYVIGTEVPVPGGATQHEESAAVTPVANAAETIELHRKTFFEAGLGDAWKRVIAVVVQPGVEFGEDFVLSYRREATRELSAFIEKQGRVYETHSTDYQPLESLRNLVQGHFSILKVGPELTFAYREAVFALAHMEDELLAEDSRSNLVRVLDEVMIRRPEHWQKYYNGSAGEQAFKRKFGMSDRIRYYWAHPEVQSALGLLINNLSRTKLPGTLVSQFARQEQASISDEGKMISPEAIISARLGMVFKRYWSACEPPGDEEAV